MIQKETDLYDPVKTWLETQGCVVQAEVGDVDVAAVKDDLLIAVELKRRLSLELLFQAADRLAAADAVYIAFPYDIKKARSARILCERMGIGILLVDGEKVHPFLFARGAREVRKNRKKAELLKEFRSRILNVNRGGTRGAVMTAYKEKALSIAFFLERVGSADYKTLREKGIDSPQNFLYANYYRWFENSGKRGVYRLSEIGKADLRKFASYRDRLDIL